MKKKTTPDTVNTPDAETLERQAANRDSILAALADLPDASDAATQWQANRDKREAERLVSQAWPDPNTLAMLAAQARFATLPEADAVRAALGLRQAARDALEVARESSRQQVVAAYTLPTPKQLPATLADFYKLVVRGKEEKDNPPRFKRFLRFRAEGRKVEVTGSRMDGQKLIFIFKPGTGKQPPTQSAEAAEKAAERQFAEYQAAQFNQEAWDDLARDYMRWWAWESTESKRRAGQARAAKAAADKKARGKKIVFEAEGKKFAGVKAGTYKIATESRFLKKSSPPS